MWWPVQKLMTHLGARTMLFLYFINHDVMFTYLNFGKLRRVAFPMGAYGAPTLKMTVLLEQK